jgi:hypothetical protein
MTEHKNEQKFNILLKTTFPGEDRRTGLVSGAIIGESLITAGQGGLMIGELSKRLYLQSDQTIGGLF